MKQFIDINEVEFGTEYAIISLKREDDEIIVETEEFNTALPPEFDEDFGDIIFKEFSKYTLFLVKDEEHGVLLLKEVSKK